MLDKARQFATCKNPSLLTRHASLKTPTATSKCAYPVRSVTNGIRQQRAIPLLANKTIFLRSYAGGPQ